MNNIGLVLEGGAMRGLYTNGVIDVFIENNINFETIVGVSAGAAFGCNLKSKQPQRAKNYLLKYCDDPRYVGLKSLLTTGNLYNTEFAYDYVPYEEFPIDFETYKNSNSKFYVVATEIKTGNAHYQEIKTCRKDEIDWFRASASMPIVSKPVKINNHQYLDGGISDSIPIKWIENKHQKNVVVLTQVEGYRKSPAKVKLIKLLLCKYPNVAKQMILRSEKYNETINYLDLQAQNNNCFIIRPSVDLGVKRIEKDKHKLEDMYKLGRKDALLQLEALKKFMDLK